MAFDLFKLGKLNQALKIGQLAYSRVSSIPAKLSDDEEVPVSSMQPSLKPLMVQRGIPERQERPELHAREGSTQCGYGCSEGVAAEHSKGSVEHRIDGDQRIQESPSVYRDQC